MSYKEIPALLSSCKSIAKAYHCSVNFSRAIHEAQVKAMIYDNLQIIRGNISQVQGRLEEARPWAVLQEVSTRWNSQFLCMRSCLKSEGAIRTVIGSEEFRSMKSLVGAFLLF